MNKVKIISQYLLSQYEIKIYIKIWRQYFGNEAAIMKFYFCLMNDLKAEVDDGSMTTETSSSIFL